MFRFRRGRPTVHEGRPGSSACRIGQLARSMKDQLSRRFLLLARLCNCRQSVAVG